MFKTFIANPIRTKSILFLLISMLIYKFACDLGYWILLTPDTITYRADFNPIKYANGLLWCFILFWGIRHEKRKVSTFILYLVFVM